ncbi:UNVERIFIED_CONTAM: hypothetical protein NCL1_07804 [Trichonephila clavipes]
MTRTVALKTFLNTRYTSFDSHFLLESPAISTFFATLFFLYIHSAAPPQPPVSNKKEEDEMRFTGLRRPDNPIPSRAFQALQKMTSGNEEVNNRQATDPHYQEEGQSDQQNEDGPVDIRYKGAYIPGRSFKMLQEMTGMNEDGKNLNEVIH